MKKNNSSQKINKAILWITSIVLVIIEIYSISIGSTYKYDFIFLLGLLWVVYSIKDKINLHPLHYFLFVIFLLLHNFGVFGWYNTNPFGIEYDFWVHGYFGLVSTLILFRTYRDIGPYKGWFMYIAIIAVVLGFSAFHELFEFGGALVVGEGEGVLFIGAGDIDEWDTQKDMLNNLIGGILAIIIYKTTMAFRKTK